MNLGFCCTVLASLFSAVYSHTKCNPCQDFERTEKVWHRQSSCHHGIRKEDFISSLREFKDIFWNFTRGMEEEYNLFEEYRTSCKIDEPLNADILKHLNKPRRPKTRFIHETYANLSYAYDIIEHVADNSNSRRLLHKLLDLMCQMIQVNRQLECKKNNKLAKKMKGFKTLCPHESRFGTCLNDMDRNAQHRQGLRKVLNILKETIDFWEICVKPNKKGKLRFNKKCSKYSKRRGKRNGKKFGRKRKGHKRICQRRMNKLDKRFRRGRRIERMNL